jgi:hypothetical protein
MKTIQHKVFMESVAYPVWTWNASARRERSHERTRQMAEAFIREIGADTVLSVTESAPTLGRFSVVVWWSRETEADDALVVRASEAEQDG